MKTNIKSTTYRNASSYTKNKTRKKIYDKIIESFSTQYLSVRENQERRWLLIMCVRVRMCLICVIHYAYGTHLN